MPRYVYVLESVSDPRQHYTGHSVDVGERVSYHNSGRCHHTEKHRPWKPIVVIEFPDDERAFRFEKYLKSGSGRAFAKRHFA
jgi:putative endonuclease